MNMNTGFDINSGQVVAYSDAETRKVFIQKTYAHLAGAVAAFAAIETLFIKMNLHIGAMMLLSKAGMFAWLLVMVLFGVVSVIAQRFAQNSVSKEKQYFGLALGVLAEAVIFLPLLGMALLVSGDGKLIQQAAVVTVALVAGLTAVVFTTGKDFSFLRPVLTIGFFVAIGIILMAMLFGFSLGAFFSGAMILFAAGSILYETSQIQYHYREDQYVSASLSLFSSVGLMFWYVLQFMLSFVNSD